MDESLVQKQSFEFALTMIRLYKKLQARQEFILSSQLLKSGTRIGATVEAALTPPELSKLSTAELSAIAEQSSPDHRFSRRAGLLTAAKQARETRYWLKLLQASRLADVDVAPELQQVDILIDSLDQLLAKRNQTDPV
ncbi:MAG: four helix bundle protein [Elainella sp.]